MRTLAEAQVTITTLLPKTTRLALYLRWPVLSIRPGCIAANERVSWTKRSYLQSFDGGRMEWGILDAGSLELTDLELCAVVARYDTCLEKAFGPLSASSGMAIKTTSAAVAMVTAIALS